MGEVRQDVTPIKSDLFKILFKILSKIKEDGWLMSDLILSHILFDWERRSGNDSCIANLPKGPFLVVAINSDEEDLVQVDYNLHLR